jgi:AcrR family transcriptional regulator
MSITNANTSCTGRAIVSRAVVVSVELIVGMVREYSLTMPTRETQPTRDRLLTEAARLFARDGYATTSVADIQLACGLTAGSGALYKHFRSKRALLDEIVGRHLATMTEGRRALAESLPDEPRRALRWMVDQTWAALARDRDLLRVLLRDLDPFPDLVERLWQGVLADVYGELASWLEALRAQGRVTVVDPAATAAVLLGSLTYYPILDALIGRVPGDVDPERFASAWVEHAAATLGLPPAR